MATCKIDGVGKYCRTKNVVCQRHTCKAFSYLQDCERAIQLGPREHKPAHRRIRALKELGLTQVSKQANSALFAVNTARMACCELSCLASAFQHEGPVGDCRPLSRPAAPLRLATLQRRLRLQAPGRQSWRRGAPAKSRPSGGAGWRGRWALAAAMLAAGPPPKRQHTSPGRTSLPQRLHQVCSGVSVGATCVLAKASSVLRGFASLGEDLGTIRHTSHLGDAPRRVSGLRQNGAICS